MKGSNEQRTKKSSWRRSRATKQMQLCLQWPGSSQDTTATASASLASPTQKSLPAKKSHERCNKKSEESIERASNNKRRRQNKNVGLSSPSSLSQSPATELPRSLAETNRLWAEKYAPTTSKDLVVAPKKVQEVQTWMEEALLPGKSKFLILVGSPGIGKSTMVHCLARDLNLDVVEWRESLSVAWQQNNYGNESVEYESPIQSFETFLTQNAVGYNSLSLENASTLRHDSSKIPKKSLVLLQDLPYCHTMDAQDRLRDSLTNFVRVSATPAIFVFSDVAEGKHRPDDLERLIESNILYSQLVRIMTIPGATKARMKRCLETVAKAERIRLSAAQHEDLHVQSGGDVRHALMTLQFDKAINSKNSAQSGGRDQRLSAFHALGKLLYAKRDESTQGLDQERGPLTFDPETIVEESGMDVSRVMDFVRHNGASFFTDVNELSGAWELLSDASYWMHKGSQNGIDTNTFPTTHARSLVGRSVANCNLHPAPNKFRQLAAPPSWTRQFRENTEILEQQIQRQGSLGEMRHTVESSSWAQERISYLKIISPNERIGLQSFFSEKVTAGMDRQAELAEIVRQEQQLILQSDDIEEFPEEKVASEENGIIDLTVSPTSTTEILPSDNPVAY